MRKVRLGLLVGVVTLVAGSAAGAGYGRTDAPTAVKAKQAVGGNIVLAHWASSPVETDLLKQVVREFERQYPKIKVTRRALDPYPEQMLAQFAARKPPDVFYVDSNVAPDWIRQGVLRDLTPLIKQYNFSTNPF